MAKNAIEQIYDQLNQVFGGTNPNQFFSMLMPGTNLDSKSYAYDTSKDKPAIVQEAESRLVDQMFDVAQVTGSSNGQRVSSQYVQALSVLTPKFNPMMPMLKKTLRDFLNTPVPANTMLDDKPFTGTLGEYYFKLYEGWIAAKLDWATQIQNKKDELSADPATEKEKFLEWYDEMAEAELAKIDEAMGKVLAVFSPSDMEAILGALASGPGGQVNEASNIVNNIRLASPDGGFFYPVNLTPDDWFLDLSSDINPTNLLNDPAFISATISARRQALMASISQVQALLNKMPSQQQLDAAKENFSKAQTTYTNAQNGLLNTYADNTATAAEIYLSKNKQSPTTDEDKNKALTELNTSAANASKAKGESPVATGATKKNGSAITVEDVKAIVDGQKKLIDAQSALLSGAQSVANAGLTLANEQASTFSDAPMLLARLQSQLADIQNMQAQLASAIAAPAPAAPDLRTIVNVDPSVVQAVITAANTANTATAHATDIVTAVTTAVGTTAALQVLKTAATTAAAVTPSPSSVAVAVRSAISMQTYDSATLAKANNVAAAAESAAAQASATATTVATAVTTAIGTETQALTALSTAATVAAAVAPAPADIINAVKKAAEDLLRQPVAKKSGTSDRFMELQLSFSTSDMQKDSTQSSSFSQTSWSVDLFFGSASGQSSTSSAASSEHDIDSSTEIQIGLKAAKVDVSRGWFDPGVFKLTGDMNSLATKAIANGPVTDWQNIGKANDGILPCFPVAFVIAKDITITFKANASSLDAVHSVLDNRSSAGGGFLCFSVSSSSASHDESSSMKTKTTGQVINITIPGPQILGWFLEFTPADQSTPFSQNSGSPEITIIDYINKLNAATQTEFKLGNGRFKGKAIQNGAEKTELQTIEQHVN
jgi:hypothetical protein